MKKILLVLMFGILALSSCTRTTSEFSLDMKCEGITGKWIPEANECEGISKESCDNLGGTFNECASACRNDPEAEMCTMQCVLVCEFE